MKTSLKKILLISFGLVSSSAFGDNQSPTGKLEAESTLIRANTKAKLKWEIKVPTNDLSDIVKINPDEGNIVAKVPVEAQVRILGAAAGRIRIGEPLFLTAWMQEGNRSPRRIFNDYGVGTGAATSVEAELDAWTFLNFEFQLWEDSFKGEGVPASDWTIRRDPVKTNDGDRRLVMVTQGQPLPDYSGVLGQEDTLDFVTPYLRFEDGRAVADIGPNDVLLFVELNRNINSESDFQDFVVLISFERAD